MIYNLAFAPKLIYLNICYCPVSGDIKDVVEALYKLLRITASLEILECNGINNLNPALNLEFF